MRTANGAQAGLHDLPRGLDRVVRVDQERGPIAEHLDEGAERLHLVDERRHPRVRHRAGERDPEPAAGLDVRRGRAPDDVRRSRGEHGGFRAVRAA